MILLKKYPFIVKR